MRKVMMGVALTSALALCGGSAWAVDGLITGRRLLIKNPPSGTTKNKVVFLSKDGASIDLPLGVTEDPRCAPDGSGAASFTVSSADAGESFTINLGGANCVNWSVNSAGNRYKYKDSSGATCKTVIVKDQRLVKAICKGAQVSFDLNPANAVDNAAVALRMGPDRRYCTAFNATSEGCDVRKDGTDNKTYLAKNCSTGPVACGASPSGAFLDGTHALF